MKKGNANNFKILSQNERFNFIITIFCFIYFKIIKKFHSLSFHNFLIKKIISNYLEFFIEFFSNKELLTVTYSLLPQGESSYLKSFRPAL
jgi:hypothetical protein